MIADRIIELRRQRGWSQEELAAQLGVTRQSVSKWEGNQSTPDVDKILLISQLFGVTTDSLLKEEDSNAATATPECARRMTLTEASAYLALQQKNARPIAVGVLLCILSPIALLVLMGTAEAGYVPENLAALIGLVTLFLFVLPAVMLFVAAGVKSEPYEYIEKLPLALDPGVDTMAKEQQNAIRQGYVRANVIGVACCVAAPVSTLVGAFSDNPLWLMVGVSITLALAAVGVFLFVVVGVPWSAIQKLLQEGDYTPLKKQAGLLLDKIAPIYWMGVTAGYLAWSFTANAWHISWVVWPVAGVLFGLLAAVCEVITKRKG